MSIASPANGTLIDPGAGVAIVVSGSDNEGVAALLLTSSGVVVSSQSVTIDPASAVAQTTFTVTIPANATGNQSLTLLARSVDIAGQNSPFASVTLPVRDVFSPTATLGVTPPDNRVVQGVTLNLTVGGADEVKVAAVGYAAVPGASATGATTSINPAVASASRSYTLTVPASLTPGEILTVTAHVTDTSGNLGLSAPFTATVVEPGGPLTGVVRFSGGSLIPNAALSVIASNGNYTTTSSATGVYTIPALLPGNVAVEAVDPISGFRGRATGAYGAYALSLRLDVIVSSDPLVNITFPTAGYPLVYGETTTLTANAGDDTGVAAVTFLVDGAAVGTDTSAPYAVVYTVPTVGSSLTVGAIVTDTEGNSGVALDITASLGADPGTTVTGRVVDAPGTVRAGATVTVTGGYTGVTGADGSFSIAGVSTILGALRVDTRVLSGTVYLKGSSTPIPPVRVGTTAVGDIVVREQVNFIGAANGNLLTPANWSGGLLPGPVDDVVIPSGKGTLILTGTLQLYSLTSGSILRVNSGGVLDAGGPVQVNTTFELNGATIRGAQILADTGGQRLSVRSGGGTLDGARVDANMTVGVEDRGTSTSLGTGVDVRNGLAFDGSITLGKGGDCEWGVLNFIGSQSLEGSGTVTFADMHNSACDSSERNGLRIAQENTTLTIGPGVTVNGSQGFIGYSTFHTGSQGFDLINLGQIRSTAAGAIVIRNRLTTNYGTIAQAGAELNVIGDLLNAGVVRPARNGNLDITGRYTQTITGTLAIEIAGTATPGTSYSRLAVSASADLDGTLAIERTASYTPTVSNSFTFLTTSSRANTFPVVTGRAIDESKSFSVVYNPTDVRLSVVSGPVAADVINDIGGGIGGEQPALFLPLIQSRSAASSQSEEAAPPVEKIFLPVLGK